MSNKSVFGQAKRNLYPDGERFVFDEGLTLRDYFAAMAMQGMMSDPRNPNEQTIVKWAYSMADAMIDERGK